MRPARRFLLALFLLSLGLLIMAGTPSDASNHRSPMQASRKKVSPKPLEDILQYISMGWDHLTRSLAKCETFADTKTAGGVLYLPADFASPPGVEERLQQCHVKLERLPERITKPGEVSLGKIRAPGLLYLENPYVVPGGQFNEMYGWDSYFIILGLLQENRRDLAKGMVENIFFEMEHYGGVLNANRTYYLTRSQPPLLTSMILAVYRAEEAAGQSDLRWLERAYGFAALDYQQWNQEPHLAGETGLSRYFDHGDGPVPEILGDPDHYYRRVAEYFLIHGGADDAYLVHIDKQHPDSPVAGTTFPVLVCDEKSNHSKPADCSAPERIALTAAYYKGDRSMRESGFDVTFRFGPFGADTHYYAPVCLNSLLYKTEKDLEQISVLLGRRENAESWNKKAQERKKRVGKYLWDEKRGLFFDYNFVTRTRSSYEYATTFYPLWAGLASEEEARAVVRSLALFEQPGGLVTSLHETEDQWDYPYGWAPIQLLAAEGLRRYGYGADADRISYEFLSMVLENFQTSRTIREKYNVVNRSLVTHIEAGYSQNVIGFGWTNGVFLELLHQLPPEWRARLRAQTGKPLRGKGRG
jgi:alpha,alpha-trehalase